MSTICCFSQSNPFDISLYSGVSESANFVRQQLKEVAATILNENVTFGSPFKKTLEELNQVLEECQNEDWDGYGAKSVNFNSYMEATKLLQNFPINIPLPEVAIDPDGEIALEWSAGRDKLFSVSIGAMKSVTYAGIFGINKVRGTESFNNELPKTILEHIQRVFSE